MNIKHGQLLKNFLFGWTQASLTHVRQHTVSVHKSLISNVIVWLCLVPVVRCFSGRISFFIFWEKHRQVSYTTSLALNQRGDRLPSCLSHLFFFLLMCSFFSHTRSIAAFKIQLWCEVTVFVHSPSPSGSFHPSLCACTPNPIPSYGSSSFDTCLQTARGEKKQAAS